MTDYTRVVDGVPIIEDRVRVSGQIHVRGKDASSLHVGTDVVVVLVGRVTAPTFMENKDGEFRRVNILKPHEIRVIADEDYMDEVLEHLDFDLRPAASDFVPAEVAVTEEPSIQFTDEPVVPVGSGQPTNFDIDDEPVTVQLKANRVTPAEVHVFAPDSVEDVIVADEVAMEEVEDEDAILAEFLGHDSSDKRVAVGGGVFGSSEASDRLRGFLGGRNE